MANESISDLIRGLFGDARELAAAHFDGARIEARQELSELKTASRSAGIAIAVFAVAAIIAAFGIAQLIAYYTPVPSWGAHLIVAALFGGIGAIALRSLGKARGQIHLIPTQELQAAKQDATWLARRTRNAVS